ncbi:MAG: hypothetical protein LQ340_002083 [Diploschistes diacapsis]|nr:MAG: hypothetical protein LQ340_002083 [Diploschistes diacapsis]
MSLSRDHHASAPSYRDVGVQTEPEDPDPFAWPTEPSRQKEVCNALFDILDDPNRDPRELRFMIEELRANLSHEDLLYFARELSEYAHQKKRKHRDNATSPETPDDAFMGIPQSPYSNFPSSHLGPATSNGTSPMEKVTTESVDITSNHTTKGRKVLLHPAAPLAREVVQAEHRFAHSMLSSHWGIGALDPYNPRNQLAPPATSYTVTRPAGSTRDYPRPPPREPVNATDDSIPEEAA